MHDATVGHDYGPSTARLRRRSVDDRDIHEGDDR